MAAWFAWFQSGSKSRGWAKGLGGGIIPDLDYIAPRPAAEVQHPPTRLQVPAQMGGVDVELDDALRAVVAEPLPLAHRCVVRPYRVSSHGCRFVADRRARRR